MKRQMPLDIPLAIVIFAGGDCGCAPGCGYAGWASQPGGFPRGTLSAVLRRRGQPNCRCAQPGG
jgi:hypothetical protein